MTTSTFSFTVRVAQDTYDLDQACQVRALSYGHHIPALRESFAEPDGLDFSESTATLVCEDKVSGMVIGTARIQTNACGPLLIEQCVDVPPEMALHGRAEITRLSVRPGADLVVKIALWKAAYLYCQAAQARWMIIGARNEALVRNYRRLGFIDLHADGRMVPLTYAGGLPHRVLTLDTYAVERNWGETRNGLYGFFFETHHPDIRLVERPRLVPRLHAVARVAA